jgi:DNA-binding CsgD family transcriptional regulator
MSMGPFIFASTSFGSGAFALGAVSVVYLQFRTRLVRFQLLFVLSLFLISSGFWVGELIRLPGFEHTGLEHLVLLLQAAGSTVNILVLPYLITSLINLSLSSRVLKIVWGWNSLFLSGNMIAYLFPGFVILLPVMGGMLVLTILFWIGVMVVHLKGIGERILKKSLLFFVIATSCYVPLLVLDMMITSFPIRTLSFLDNFSMPLYFGALNFGSFIFAGRFLNRGAYADDQGVTKEFLEAFGISPRESELVNKLLKGLSNKEISDILCISVKTVENHLGSIYRKVDVTGRVQLIHLLHSWEKG